MLTKLRKSASGIVASQALSFLALPVISRLYSDTDFARYSLLLAGIGLFGTIASLRYEMAVVIPPSVEEAARLFWGGLGCVFLVSIAVGLLFTRDLTLDILGLRGLISSAHAGILVGLAVCTMASLAIVNSWVLRLEMFGVNAIGLGFLTLFTVVLQVCLGWLWSSSFTSLSWSVVIAQGLSNLLVLSILAKLGKLPPPCPPLRDIGPALARHFRFPCYSVPYTLSGTLRERGAIVVMESFVEVGTIGTYSMLQRILNVPMNFVSSVMRPVIFSQAARHGSKSVEGRVQGALALLLLLIAPGVGLFLASAPWLVPWFLGAKWTMADKLAEVLIWPALAMILANWLDRLLVVNNKQGLSLALNATFMVLVLLAIWLPLHLGYGFMVAVRILSAVLSLYQLTYLWLAFKTSDFSFRPLLAPLLLAVVSGSVVYAIGSYAFADWALAPAAGVTLLAAGVAYLALARPLMRAWRTLW